jgi:hypothetical protein
MIHARTAARLARALLLACAIPALGAAHAHAQTLERIWSGANEAYFRGDVASAAEQYQRLVDAGVQDPDVYMNLALAHARLGQLGGAVLNFERSLWLRPGDATVEQELAAARTELGKRQAEREGEATMQARPPLSQALVRSLSADLLAWLVLVLDVAFFATLLLRKFSRNEPLRLGLAVAAPLLALLLCAAGAGLAVKTEVFREGRAAIVVRDGAELREGPDAAAQVRATAREGDSARTLREEAGFVHVQLSGGARGWMSTKDVGTIRPD